MTETLASLPNRNPVLGARGHERIDPYWDGLWGAGSQASWFSRGDARRAYAAGLFVPDERRELLDPQVALAHAVLGNGQGPSARRKMLAAVTLWRSLTTPQLSAITGIPHLGRPGHRHVWSLWRAGLLSVGSLTHPLPGVRLKMPPLVRADHGTDFDNLYERLSYQDWVGVTGGQPWRWGSQFDRHNVLATELALRIAEYTSVPVVLGEALSTLALIAPGSTTLPTSIRSGDVTVVRHDGMRVVIEMTTSASNLKVKAARWADTLLADDDGATSVLFVIAPHPDRGRSELARSARKAIGQAARASMSHVLAGVPARMAMADWDAWFPGSGLADTSFITLRANRPTDTKGQWEVIDLLDPFALRPRRTRPALTAILDNVHALYGVPHWLRTGAGPDLIAGRAAAEGWPTQPVQQGRRLGSAERAALRAAAEHGGRPRTVSA